MKKTLIFFTLLAAAAAIVTACGDKEPEKEPGQNLEGEILPLPTSEEVTAWFEKYLPPVSGVESEIFFVDDDEGKCLMINSIEELKAIMRTSVELPAIDFKNNTLIIGQQVVPTTSFSVLRQNLDVGSKKITLDLTAKVPEASYQGFSCLYYWGIYQKLIDAPIEVNVTHQK
ncbi:MAG: hypothetical protein LBU97_02850 [Alistipes sp.]|jgi:hypothetical protein|nr:hypothetical protein [Alistipes sp.]